MLRRHFLGTLAALAPGMVLAGGALGPHRVGAVVPAGEAVPFDAAWLVERARGLAAAPYRPVPETLPPILAELGYDQYFDIRYRPDRALWHGTGLAFQAQFFHMGFLYRQPVTVHEVVEGMARPLRYSSDLFAFGRLFDGPPDLPIDLGFAGLRLHHPLNQPGLWDELCVFLGASYFRALGRGHLYGISARGLAIDTATSQGEEFPVFRDFWLERPGPRTTETVIHALLDSPSATGAYRFAIRPGDDTVMTVAATLFPRRRIDKLGIAPLTSMFLFGTNDRRGFDDFRPQVHDSDGLSLWTGTGEWLWRPLVNPAELQRSLFQDRDPRGFGLMQRERDFNAYQDLEARYERRPSLWVEPIGSWGAGAVELVELPTPFEYHDNIVAAWTPATPAEPGAALRLDYRLHWCTEPPVPFEGARVVSTRLGSGGISGTGPTGTRKFVIDFEGGRLAGLPAAAAVETRVTVARGEALHPVAQKNEVTGGWRAFFDVRPAETAGGTPLELRCHLALAGEPLSEIWTYQWSGDQGSGG